MGDEGFGMSSRIELGPGQRIVFIGDSITAAESGTAVHGPLGNGYVHFAGNFLVARYPRLNLEIINTGVNGNTVRELKRRWEKDCIGQRPDVLSVLIGINDLWTQHAGAEYLRYAVYPDEYELTYRLLLSEARQRCNCKFVMMEPFMFCGDPENAMLKGLRTYIDIVHKLAAEFDAVLVELQSGIDEEIAEVLPERWSMDSVHPYAWAHAWIAQRWLDSTGL